MRPPPTLLIYRYKDRGVESQRRWSEAFFRRLATLPLVCPLKFKFAPLNYEIIVGIREPKWYMYIRMPFYLYISIYADEHEASKHAITVQFSVFQFLL